MRKKNQNWSKVFFSSRKFSLKKRNSSCVRFLYFKTFNLLDSSEKMKKIVFWNFLRTTFYQKKREQYFLCALMVWNWRYLAHKTVSKRPLFWCDFLKNQSTRFLIAEQATTCILDLNGNLTRTCSRWKMVPWSWKIQECSG